MEAMAAPAYTPGPHSPLRVEEVAIVQELLATLAPEAASAALTSAILSQAESLDAFGALLARYPSPLDVQMLGDRRRGLDTLVAALCSTDRTGFTLRAPTQAIVGRALNLAQINFFRLLWHVCADVADEGAAARLRENTARRLRTSVYTLLVEEVLRDLASDHALAQQVREHAVHHLVNLWGRRLTWRVSEFLPLLEATWEARARVAVAGGTLLGTSEMFQLLARGGDPRFVDLLLEREHGTDETQAFREFLFGRSSEELQRLTERMAREQLSSIELDSRLAGAERDAGSIFYEFFHARFLESQARRLASLPGPKRTAEGYVVLAWIEQPERWGGA